VAKRKQKTPAAPGFDIPIDVYHADTSRISKSGLDEIHKSPAHYFYRYLDPNKKPSIEKEWAVTGNLVGCAAVTPDLFEVSHVVLNDKDICEEIAGKDWQKQNKRPRSTIKYAEWMEKKIVELEGKTILLPEQMEQVIAMRDSLRRNRAIRALLASGWAERTFYHTDEDSGVECRERPDWICGGFPYLLDCKTGVDVSPGRFGNSAHKFRYHVQDAFYTDGCIKNGLDIRGFVLACVEKTPPYNSAAYLIPPEATQLGRIEYKADLLKYAESRVNNKWPGYDDEFVQTLQFPQWAYKRGE
jgi:hypothetical protein